MILGGASKFEHLLRLSDARGTFEHARYREPRPEHGYCSDDMARVLLVAAREAEPAAEVVRLSRLALSFLSGAQVTDGRFRNRLDAEGHWVDRASAEDCWGRSIWALGEYVASSRDDELRARALAMLDPALRVRSRWRRSMAFASLGAAALLDIAPAHAGARRLLEDAAVQMEASSANGAWMWPEERLEYANALLPDAMIAVGRALERAPLAETGLSLLRWLLEKEMAPGHLSVTPTGGRSPGDGPRRFDQQPIEVAAIADACARALVLDGDGAFVEGLDASVGWFCGANDGQVEMWDPATGAGFDGLSASGPNLNCGAESTLAAIATLQHARRRAGVTR